MHVLNRDIYSYIIHIRMNDGILMIDISLG
uniref:Uncharacterized protein n=1 Tax=Arundo donax TaxID=35708 RepID=A0A0A9BKV3_ARUDO